MNIKDTDMKKQVKIRTLNNKGQKEQYVNDVWQVLVEGYKNVQGGLYFKSKVELIANTHIWKVICYRGEVVAVTIYKAKKGLKLVALSAGRKFRNIAVEALKKVIKRDLKKCWMELSEAAEKFVLQLGGDKYVLTNDVVESVLGKEIKPIEDGVHYMREIMGIQKQKILLGTVKYS